MQNIIDNNWKKGLEEYKKDTLLFHNAPSVLNRSSLIEDYMYNELQALANDEMYQGKGIRRYDGTWATPEEVLDDDVFGDDMMRISYEEGQLNLKDWDLTKSLGWLNDVKQNLKNYVESSDDKTKQAYYDTLDGKTKELLKNIDKYNPSGSDVQGRFTLMYDEQGNPYWQEVLTDSNTRKKLETAGLSLVNSYGSTKYADGALKSGIRSFAKGVTEIIPGIVQFGAMTEDLHEATANAMMGNGFKSDYDIANEVADAMQEWVDNSMVGQTSDKASEGLFDNWESFASGLGQGASSLVGYMGSARAISWVGKGAKALTKGAGNLLANSGIKALAKGGEKVVQTLSAQNLNSNSLGTVAKALNKLLVENPGTISMYGAGMILNSGEAYKAARQAGLTLEDSATIGLITGIANTLVEQKYGPNTLNKWLAGAKGAETTAKIIIKEVGGDVSKLDDIVTSKNVLNKIVNLAGKAMNAPVVGTALEEGSEEAIQGFVKNAVESFYDSFVAPNAIEGSGKFGTNLFGKEEWMGMLEEGTVGAILGAFGGFVNNSRKENESIIPFIANGDFESLKAGAALAKAKGAISQEQYDGIMERATALNNLRNENSSVFNDVLMNSTKETQLDLANNALKMLRDQKEYAESKPDLSTGENQLDNDRKFRKVLNNSIDTTNSLAGVKAFAQQLKNNGKRVEANRLEKIIKQSEKQSESLVKIDKKSSATNRLASTLVRQQLSKQIFSLQNDINSTDTRIAMLQQIQREVASQEVIAAINDVIASNSSISKSNDRIEKLLEEYENVSTSEDRRVAISSEINKELDKQQKTIVSSKKLTGQLGVKEYVEAQKNIQSLNALKRINQAELSFISSDSVKEGMKELQTLIEESEKETKAKNEREQELNKKKEQEAAVPTNDTIETLYSDYKNSLSAETDVTPERKKRIDNIINGDELTQVNELESEKQEVVKALNNLPKEEKTSQRADLLRDELKRLNKIIPHLRNKYNITKTEADKNKRYKTNLTTDESVYTDNDGNKYTIDRPSTQYSENEGLIYSIKKDGEEDSNEYSETQDGDFLNQLIDESGIPLTTKIRQDKRAVALQLRKVSPELAFTFEPVSETETKINTSETIGEKVNTFANKLKCLIFNDVFKKIIADPKTDARQFSGKVEYYIWDKADKNTKEAKQLFDQLRKEKKTWDELSQDDKDTLLDYLPIQLKLVHPYIKKNGKEYENTVAIPARKSATSKDRPMHEDQVAQREALIKNLLENGTYEIKKGDIEIQPGYFNTNDSTKPNTITDPVTGETYTLSDLPTGDLRDVESLNIVKEGDHYYVTLPMGNETKKMRLTIGIAGQTGTIQYTYVTEKGDVITRHADGQGSPGTPYLIIPGFLNLNNKTAVYPLKLNPRRIDKNAATTIAKLMYSLAKGYATKEVLLNTPVLALSDVFGIKTQDRSLTVGDVLDDLIYWGNKTRQNDPDPENNKDYLKNKQVYIDFKKGVVKYGENETVLGEGEAELNKFIHWIMNNKSFAIDRSRINANDIINNTYEIEGSIGFIEGTDYTTSMIDNKLVATNLSTKGPLFRGQAIRLNTVRSEKKNNPVTEPKPVNKPKETKKPSVSTPVTGEIVSTINEDGVRQNAKAMKQAMQTTNGTITVSGRNGNTKIYDGNDKELGDLTEFTFTVEDGKINGEEVDYNATFSKEKGVFGIIEKIVNKKYPKAELRGLLETATFTPSVAEAEEKLEKPVVNNPRVDEVYKKAIDSIQKKFKNKKPSKADITEVLDALVNSSVNRAQLYGFKDYKEARQLLKEVGTNGKTLEQMLIDYMSSMSTESDAVNDPLAAIASQVFTGKNKKKGVSRLVSNQDMKQGYNKISEKEKKQLGKILGRRRPIKWVEQFINVLDYVGNPAKAFGVTMKSVTEIYNGAKEGTGYHESFHNISLFALSSEERQNMYDEARKRYSEITDKENKFVEEFLADKFMNYALSMQEQGKVNTLEYKGLSGFFKKMWDYVKAFFGVKPNYQDLNTFFKKIYSGHYANVNTNKDSLVYFDNTYGKNGKVPLMINGKTLSMDSRVFTKIINNLTAQLLFDNDITSLESVRKGINFDEFKTKLTSIRDSYANIINTSDDFDLIEGATALVSIYNEMLDNWTSVFKPFIEGKLANYGIRRRAEDATITIDEDLKNLINDEVVSAWEINSKHNAKAEVRMLFLALKKTSTADPITKLPQYENPDVVWYNVISKLHSAKSFDEMMDRLETLSNETNKLTGDNVNPYSELKNLILESGNETLKTQFFITMKKHKNKFINMTFSEDGNGLDMRIADADINKRSRKINTAWSKAFAQSNPLTKEGKENIRNVQKNYEQLLEDIKNESISVQDNILKVVELLAGLNIIVDDATIQNIMYLDKYKDSTDKKSLNNFVLSNPFSNIFAKKGKTLLNRILQDNIDVNKIDSLLANETLTSTLAESYVRMNPSSEDDSVLGPEGNAVYAYSENNTITSMFEEWLKDEEFLSELMNDVYSQHSRWLNQLTDSQTRRKLGVKTMLAVMNRDDYSTSRGYLDISDKEDLIIKLKAVMDGKLLLPTLANKKSYYFIDGLKKELVRLTYVKGQGYQLNDQVIDTFMGYALDELNSIKLAIQQKEEFVKALGISEQEFNSMNAREQRALIESKLADETFKIAYSDLVENYHFALSDDNIKNEDGTIFYDKKMVLKGNGYKFRYFRELEEMNISNSVDAIEKFINSEQFKDQIRKILNSRVNETVKLFIDNGIINVDKKLNNSQKEALENNSSIAVEAIIEKAYNYIPVDKKGDMMSAKDAIASAIADFAINTAVSTIEFEKVISGDLAFYKSKSISAALDDRVKRYSALTSTRQIMNSEVKSNDDYAVDFDTKRYRSTTLLTNTSYSKEMYDIMYNKYVGTIENPGLLYQRFIDFAERGVGKYAGKDKEELFELAKEDANQRLKGYLKTDPTDAQVWISPKMFRKLSIMNGEWSAEKEKAYNLLESDAVLTVEQEEQALALVMQPLKYVHYGFMFNSKGLKIPVYDKMSLATIFKRMVKGTNLKPMYDYMLENDVDMIKMESAVKSGNRPKQAYYNQNGEVNDLTNSLVYEQDFKYIGKQLVTDPHEVERSTLLTQFIKIAVSNVNKEDSYKLDGRTITGQELLDQYNSAIENLSHRGVERIKEKFGFKNGKVDKRKLIKMLNEAALQTNVPQNLIDALQYSEQDNDYYIELSTLPSLNWIHSRIISLISKETIDITTPGNAFYQTTSFGHDLTGNYRKLVGDNTLKKYDDKLRFKNENGRLEVKLSINLFRGAIPSRYKTFEEQRKYILENKELFAFSYRVPTQGMNSTLPIEIVDVVPSNAGDVIFLPLEVTALTGSDFDIDKMYLARYNYYDENGKMKKVQFIDRDDYSSEEEFLDAIWHSRYGKVNDANYLKDRKDILGVVEYVAKMVGQNGALSTEDKMSLIDLAQDYSKYLSRKTIMSILDSRVDDFDGVNKVRAYIEKSIPTKNDVIPVEKFIERNMGKSMWDLNTEEAVENRLLEIFGATLTSDNHYIDATTPLDVTTGPLKDIADLFESNNTVNSLDPLFPRYQEDMKSKNTGADSGIGPMALINVFRTFLQIADIQLNTVVGDNNIMQKLGIDTLNKTFDDEGLSILDWTSALINAHVDAAKDPYIIRLNVNKYTYNMTAFMISAGFGKSTFYFLPQPILKDLANNYMRVTGSDIGIEGFEKYSKKYLSDVIEDYESMISKKAPKRVNEDEVVRNMRDIQWLEDQIKTPENERDDEWYATQLTILDVFLKIQEYADGMRDAINAVQIDTKKYGINSAELIQFGHLVDKVEGSEYFANPKDLFDKTFIGAKYKNSIKLMFDLLGTEIMDFSPGFVQMVEEIEKMTYTYYKRDERVVNSISNEIKSVLYGPFFNSYLQSKNMTVKDLFYGKNSVVARIEKLQKQIAEGEYRELKDNELLKMLLPNVFNNDTDPMTFENSTTKQRDTDSKNAYTFAWMDLLEHEDEYIQQLGNDLILYSFYMGGGLSNGVYNFYDLAPYGYLANFEVNGKTFQDYVKNLMVDLNTDDAVQRFFTQEALDSIFKSAWKNKDLVPEINLQSRGEDRKITVQSDKNGNTEYIRLSSAYTGFMSGMDGYFKPYVKLYNKKDPNSTQLFKLVGYFETETGIELVYGKTNKLGFDFKGFRIKESTSKSALPTNNIATDFSEDIQLGDKIKNGNIFTAINPFDRYSIASNDVTITGDGDVEAKVPVSDSQFITKRIQSVTLPNGTVISGERIQKWIDVLSADYTAETNGYEENSIKVPYREWKKADAEINDVFLNEIVYMHGEGSTIFYHKKTASMIFESKALYDFWKLLKDDIDFREYYFYFDPTLITIYDDKSEMIEQLQSLADERTIYDDSRQLELFDGYTPEQLKQIEEQKKRQDEQCK